MKKEIDHDQLEYELELKYEKNIHSKIYDKTNNIIGIILSIIYEESCSDLIFKVLKVKDEKEFNLVCYKIARFESKLYSENNNGNFYDDLNDFYLELSYELDSDRNLFFIKRSDINFSKNIQLNLELKDSCFYSNNEKLAHSWGNVEIISGAYKGQVGYYDDDDVDEEGRPCGIIYLGKLFESSYLLLPYGSFKVTCKNNSNTDEFVEKNDELSKMLGVVNTKLN